MWRLFVGFSAVRNTQWAEKKIKTVPHVFLKTKLKLYDSAEVCIMGMMETRTI